MYQPVSLRLPKKMATCGQVEISVPGSTYFAYELPGTSGYKYYFMYILTVIITLYNFFRRTQH
jgi:hypothetical protein